MKNLIEQCNHDGSVHSVIEDIGELICAVRCYQRIVEHPTNIRWE